jgi:two-component system response regulator DevR
VSKSLGKRRVNSFHDHSESAGSGGDFKQQGFSQTTNVIAASQKGIREIRKVEMDLPGGQTSSHAMESVQATPLVADEPMACMEAQGAAVALSFKAKPVEASSTSRQSVAHMPSKRCEVFIVHSQELVRLGLRALLQSDAEFGMLGEASSSQDALAIIVKLRPDIVILDLRAQDDTAIETAKEVLARVPSTRVVFLADTLDDTILVSAVATGAHGYLLKEARTDTLLHALRTVRTGQTFLDSGITRHTFAYLRKLAARGSGKGRHLLSSQEQRLLPLIAQGKTNKEIAAELGLSDKTVKNYLANVYTKLRLTRRSQAAAFYLTHLS